MLGHVLTVVSVAMDQARNTAVPGAITRALPLLAEPPRAPNVRHGYLDLLGPQAPAPSGLVQALWQSTLGTAVYDPAQALLRRMFAGLRPPAGELRLPSGGTALDVGSGPGTVTAGLARDAGPEGLALGVDVSESMLRRAVRDHAGTGVGFLRADARRLPFRDATIDVVTCLAVLQLVPEPATVLAELARVLVHGGRLAILVPSVPGIGGGLARFLPGFAGVNLLAADDVAATLREHGVVTLTTRTIGPWFRLVAEKR